MTFHEVRFSDDISYGSSGGPEFSTDVIITGSGSEQRNINWADARARYNVAHALRTETQLNALIAFFRARKGRAYGFRFKDWADYNAAAQLIGIGNGVKTSFQLIKIYTSGSEAVAREIKKPVIGTVKIYFADILQSAGFTVDYTSGMVNFSAAPANGVEITADFEFDVPVRFDTDFLSANLESYGIGALGNIPLVEIRV